MDRQFVAIAACDLLALHLCLSWIGRNKVGVAWRAIVGEEEWIRFRAYASFEAIDESARDEVFADQVVATA